MNFQLIVSVLLSHNTDKF